MSRINHVEIETNHGLREFELINGDITKLAFDVDIIVISAFRHQYQPIPNTVIGSLLKAGVNVHELAKNPLFDFRETLGIWVSSIIPNQNFKYIICVEIIGTKYTLNEVFKNLFSVISFLEIHNYKLNNIAIPLLGAGNQNISAKSIISPLINSSLDFLQYSRFLNKVTFVLFEKDKILEFNKSMNEILDRVKVNHQNNNITKHITKNIKKSISLIKKKRSDLKPLLFEYQKSLTKSSFSSFEINGQARKILEVIIDDINPKSKKIITLMDKIDSLENRNIAPWVINFMHTIRIFGNETLHHREKANRVPLSIEQKDFEISLYCIQVIFEFYYSQINKNQ